MFLSKTKHQSHNSTSIFLFLQAKYDFVTNSESPETTPNNQIKKYIFLYFSIFAVFKQIWYTFQCK